MASEAVLGRRMTWVFPATEADWDGLYAEQLPRVYNFFRYRNAQLQTDSPPEDWDGVYVAHEK